MGGAHRRKKDFISNNYERLSCMPEAVAEANKNNLACLLYRCTTIIQLLIRSLVLHQHLPGIVAGRGLSRLLCL